MIYVRTYTHEKYYPVRTDTGKMHNLKRGYLGFGTKHNDCMATICSQPGTGVARSNNCVLFLSP